MLVQGGGQCSLGRGSRATLTRCPVKVRRLAASGSPVQGGEVVLRHLIPFGGSFLVPATRFDRVQRNTPAIGIGNAEIICRVRASLFIGRDAPLERVLKVTRQHALSRHLIPAEVRLGQQVTSLGCGPEEPKRPRGIGRTADSMQENVTEVVFSGHEGLGARLLVPTSRRRLILRPTNAILQRKPQAVFPVGVTLGSRFLV